MAEADTDILYQINRENRREVLLALDYIEAVARLRGWIGAAKKEG